MTQAVGRGLIVAVVVMAETLLSENNFAFQNGYKIKDNREILLVLPVILAQPLSDAARQREYFTYFP